MIYLPSGLADFLLSLAILLIVAVIFYYVQGWSLQSEKKDSPLQKHFQHKQQLKKINNAKTN